MDKKVNQIQAMKTRKKNKQTKTNKQTNKQTKKQSKRQNLENWGHCSLRSFLVAEFRPH